MYGGNNIVAWQKYQSTHKPEVKGNRGQIEEEKAYAQARPNPKKKQDAKNEDPNSSMPQRVKNKQQDTQQNQTNPHAMTNT